LFLANLWNYAVERDWPKLRIRSAQPLNGVTSPEPAPWTLSAFLTGETQRAASMNLGRTSPVFPISVRAKNQTMYSLFGVSGAANIAIGRGGQLFGWEYIDEFALGQGADRRCGLDNWPTRSRKSPPPRDAWQGLRLSDLAIEARAPSAISAGRADMPGAGAGRAGRQARSVPRGAGTARRTLCRRRAINDAERTNYAIDFFPRGGTHWNLLGAALTLRDINRAFEASPGGSPVGRFEFDWREDDLAKGTDRDLLDLLNLFWPADHYPTAIVEGREKRGAMSANAAYFNGGRQFHARTHRRFGANALSANDRLLVLHARQSWRRHPGALCHGAGRNRQWRPPHRRPRPIAAKLLGRRRRGAGRNELKSAKQAGRQFAGGGAGVELGRLKPLPRLPPPIARRAGDGARIRPALHVVHTSALAAAR